MISRHEASVGQAPVERERNLMRPDGEREREGEGGRRGEKCTRPNRAGYRCISDDAFQEFRARSTLEEFFFPLLPSFCDVGRLPPLFSLARSLARPRIQPKQCSHSSSTDTTTTTTLLFLANRRDQLSSQLFYSIRDSSRFWGNVKMIYRSDDG